MLLKKMLRDMLRSKAQFISIFLMSLLGVAVFAGITAEWAGMQADSDRYYADTNMADMWVLGNNFTPEDIQAAKGVKGVASVQGKLVFDGTAAMGSEPVLRLNVQDDNGISRPMSVEGEAFDASADGVWLDREFAQATGLRVGDILPVKAGGMRVEKKILGLIIHPEYLYNVKDETELIPNHKAFGFAFMPKACLPGADTLPVNELLLKLENPAGTPDVQAKLEAALKGRYTVILTRSTHPSVATFNQEIAQNRAMGGIFPVVFFLVAALMMLTTMTRLTSAQRVQTGALRALGFTRRGVLLHYVNYGVWLGLLGGLLGLVAGPLIVPPMMYELQKTTYTLPGWHASLPLSCFAAPLFAALCCAASGWLSCRAELKETPAAMLRPKPPKSGRHMPWEKGRIWQRLGFSAQWNFRDVLRSPVRSAMAVLGVAGSMALLLCALGLRDTIGGVSALMYGELNAYQSKILVTAPIPPDALEALRADFAGQPLQETAIELKAGNVKKDGNLSVLGEGNLVRFQDESGRPMKLPEEGVALSRRMAQMLNLEQGDTVSWRILGTQSWQSAIVSAVYRTPMNQGITLSRKAYESMGNKMAPTAILTESEALGAQSRASVASVQRKDDLIKSYDSMLEGMMALVGILVLAAVILGVVVLYNLGTMSFTERTRELATLKVLGFFPRQIRKLLRMQNVWLTLLGTALGVPAGFLLIGSIISGLSDTLDLQAAITPVSICACVLGTFLLSMLVNAALSRKVNSIDMVSPFKAVE